MIEFNKYSDHNVDEDPVIFLSCGHFFAISTLDGYFGVETATEKAKVCPECRSPIDRVYRYGRAIRLIELRALERKHLASVQAALGSITDSVLVGAALKKTDAILKEILQSPMRKVYEASGGAKSGLEVPVAPSGPLIQCLQIQGKLYASQVVRKALDTTTEEQVGREGKNRKVFQKAEAKFLVALNNATESQSRRSAANLRLDLARLYLQYYSFGDELKKNALPLLDEVSNSGFAEFQDPAKMLRDQVMGSVDREEIAQVLRAMGSLGHTNPYGASASDHWFECPNGHPYFIGECGGAMQESRCIECGAVVGGGSHQLNPTNRSVGGRVREVMNMARRV